MEENIPFPPHLCVEKLVSKEREEFKEMLSNPLNIKIIPMYKKLEIGKSESVFVCCVSLSGMLSDLNIIEKMRDGIDLVFIIDISGSMYEKLNLVKNSIEFIIGKLEKCDRVSIIGFNNEATIYCPLTVMSENGKSEVGDIVKKINASGGTIIEKGVRAGLDILANRAEVNQLTAIMLLSDGCDASGTNATEQINKAIEEYKPKIRTSFKMHTFGYGADNDSLVMNLIADLTRGNYYYIEKFERIRSAFNSCMSEYILLLAYNIQVSLVKLKCKIPFKISKVFFSNKDNSVEISNILFGNKKDVVFILNFNTIDIQGISTITPIKAIVSYTLNGEIKRNEEVFLEVELAKKNEKILVDKEVQFEFYRVKEVEVLKEMSENANKNLFDKAREIGKAFEKELLNSSIRNDHKIKVLLNDIVNAQVSAESIDSWSSGGSSQVYSISKAHLYQISSNDTFIYNSPIQFKYFTKIIMEKDEPLIEKNEVKLKKEKNKAKPKKKKILPPPKLPIEDKSDNFLKIQIIPEKNKLYFPSFEGELVCTLTLESLEEQTFRIENKRNAIDLVFLIDTSGSMPDTIDQFKNFINFFLTKLKNNDRVSIIGLVDSEPYCQLTNMNDDGKFQVSNIVNSLKTIGVTDIEFGVKSSLRLLANRTLKNKLTFIIILNDGFDKDTETVNKRISKTIEKYKSKIGSFKIHTFGYGKNYDSKVMNLIAESTGGNFYHTENELSLKTTFTSCMGELISVLVSNIHVSLEVFDCCIPFELSKVYTYESTSFDMPDLLYADRKDVVFILKYDSTKKIKNKKIIPMKAIVTYSLNGGLSKTKEKHLQLEVTQKKKDIMIEKIVQLEHFRVRGAEVLKYIVNKVDEKLNDEASEIGFLFQREIEISNVINYIEIMNILKNVNDAQNSAIKSESWISVGRAQAISNFHALTKQISSNVCDSYRKTIQKNYLEYYNTYTEESLSKHTELFTENNEDQISFPIHRRNSENFQNIRRSFLDRIYRSSIDFFTK